MTAHPESGSYFINPYILADFVHGAFTGRHGTLSPDEAAKSEVTLASWNPNNTQKLHIEGIVDSRPAYQSLALDKNGVYHLSTVFTEYGGPHLQYDIKSHTPEDAAVAIAGSLFTQKLVQIQQERQAPKKSDTEP